MITILFEFPGGATERWKRPFVPPEGGRVVFIRGGDEQHYLVREVIYFCSADADVLVVLKEV